MIVNLTIVIQKQVGFEGGAIGGESIDTFKFFTLGIERMDFENVLEESDAGGGGNGSGHNIIIVYNDIQ